VCSRIALVGGFCAFATASLVAASATTSPDEPRVATVNASSCSARVMDDTVLEPTRIGYTTSGLRWNKVSGLICGPYVFSWSSRTK